MKSRLLACVLACGAASASGAASDPSLRWTFDGAANGLRAVGGVLRFVEAADTPGAEGQALALGLADGDVPALTAPLDDGARLGASYTIETWIRPAHLGEWRRLVLNWGRGNQYAYHLALHHGQASLLHGQADGTYVACEGGSVEPDRWQQVVGVADAAAKSLRTYLDGRLVATVPFDGTALTARDEALAIGDSASLPHAPFRFVGTLDSVTLWKRPLAGDEIAARFAAHPKSPPPPPLRLAAEGEILFAERQPGRDYSSHLYANFGYDCGDENYWLHGADGGRLAIFNPATREARTLIEDAGGAFRDPCVHYDGRKALFSYRKGGTHQYHLYEITLDGTGLKQLTDGDRDDIEPAYLPDGDIVFCSTRSMRYVLCWLAPVATLHRCRPDGSGIRMLSSGAVTQLTPAVLPDGRILFTLWDYNHRATTAFKHLWVMNPDGTGLAAYFGNQNWEGGDPGYVDARPIPGTDEVVYVRAGHCSNEHAGRLMRVSAAHGPDDLSQARALTGEGFRDPWPTSAHEFLAAHGNDLVAVSDSGTVTRLFSAGRMVHEPRLIAPRPREALIPSRVDPANSNGVLFVSNVYVGRRMEGLAPGTIRKLLVMEQLPKPANYHGGGSTPLAHGGKWTINRILGTVPVEADGSAHFEVPAGRSVYLAALDERDLSVKQMRSFVTVQPGERASCVGCHEYRTQTATAPGAPLAARRAPSRIEPIPGAPAILDFPRDVQPILDRRCVECHQPDRRDGGVDLCGDRGPTYSLAYYNLLLHRQVKDTAGYGWKGERNRSGEPLGNDAPYEAFSGAAPLMKLLDGSHHGARLTDQERTVVRLWLDSATPYAGTYAAYGTGQIGGWWRLNEPTREMANDWPATKPCVDAVTRRCASCHEAGQMPRFVTDGVNIAYNDFEGFMRPTFRVSRHHIFNLTRPEKSLALMAPLAKSAGGYAEGALPDAKPVKINLATAPAPFVHPVVFATATDPDYQAILAHLRAAGARLEEIKRFDMPGFQPRYEYLREMKRDGVLPADFDLKNPAPVNAYELDEQYWRLFWPERLDPTP